MLVVFSGFGVAEGSILGGLGRVLDASKPHLSMNVDVRQHASQKCSSCNKTTVFAMFYKLRSMAHTATKRVFCMALGAFLDMVQELLQKTLLAVTFCFSFPLCSAAVRAQHIRRLPKGEPSVPDSRYKCLT